MTLSAPAIPVMVSQVQGAGAAFSAALIHAHHDLYASRSLDRQLRFACAGSTGSSEGDTREPHGIQQRKQPLVHVDGLG
jgi:hypothetical protein